MTKVTRNMKPSDSYEMEVNLELAGIEWSFPVEANALWDAPDPAHGLPFGVVEVCGLKALDEAFQPVLDAIPDGLNVGKAIEDEINETIMASYRRAKTGKASPPTAPAAGGTVDPLVSEACGWNQDDEDSDIWSSDCGNAFVLFDGDPRQNSMRFCCYCGRPLDVFRWEDR
jgi:hypothetical protein